MTLDAYLKANGESEDAFAKRAGISRATVFRIKKDGAKTKTTIQKVMAASKGEVTANDLLGITTRRKRAA